MTWHFATPGQIVFAAVSSQINALVFDRPRPFVPMFISMYVSPPPHHRCLRSGLFVTSRYTLGAFSIGATRLREWYNHDIASS